MSEVRAKKKIMSEVGKGKKQKTRKKQTLVKGKRVAKTRGEKENRKERMAEIMQVLFQNGKKEARKKGREKRKEARAFKSHCLFCISLIMRGAPPSRKEKKDIEVKTRKGHR